MQSIFDYEEFKEDVFTYLKEVIDKYQFRYNEEKVNEESGPNIFAFLDNNFCRLEINTLGMFPWCFMDDTIYFLEGENALKIDWKLLDKFLGINRDDCNKPISFFEKQTENIKVRIDSKRYEYILTLCEINYSLLNCYNDILSGKYTYPMYQGWLSYVEKNYDLKNKNIDLPSYDEYISF